MFVPCVRHFACGSVFDDDLFKLYFQIDKKRIETENYRQVNRYV